MSRRKLSSPSRVFLLFFFKKKRDQIPPQGNRFGYVAAHFYPSTFPPITKRSIRGGGKLEEVKLNQ